MEKSQRTPDQYLADLEDNLKDDLVFLDSEIAKRFPGEARALFEGTFWGGSDQQIIGYGDLTHEGARGIPVEWFMVGLARQKNYISMYVNAVGDGGYLLNEYRDKLGKVKTGAASISFSRVADVDTDALMELVERAAAQI